MEADFDLDLEFFSIKKINRRCNQNCDSLCLITFSVRQMTVSQGSFKCLLSSNSMSPIFPLNAEKRRQQHGNLKEGYNCCYRLPYMVRNWISLDYTSIEQIGDKPGIMHSMCKTVIAYICRCLSASFNFFTRFNMYSSF